MSDTQTVFPWHTTLQRQLLAQRQQDVLHPVLMLCAQRFAGKKRFAHTLAGALLCLSPEAVPAESGKGLQACGQCRSCELYAAGSHPDFHWLQLTEKRKTIGVDAVRELTEKLQLRAQLRGARVAVISAAELLTEAASNALLKSLEEPGADTFFLLLAERAGSVLPTVRSRSQRINLCLPSVDELGRWLSGDAPDEEIAAVVHRARGYPELALQLMQGESAQADLDELASAVLAGRASGEALAKQIDAALLGDFLDTLQLKLLELRRLCEGDTVQAGQLGEAQLDRLSGRVTDAKRNLGRSPNVRLCLDSLVYRFQAALRSVGA